MKQLLALFCLLYFPFLSVFSQITFPVNGVTDSRNGYYAFTNATIVQDSRTVLRNATMVIREGRILSIGHQATPKDAVSIDCADRYIYPSFIDIFSDYGVAARPDAASGGFFSAQQLETRTKGPYNWNQAIRSEVDAGDLFAGDEKKAGSLRSQGFGAVVTHQQDGIARGTGIAVALIDAKENLAVIKEKVAAFYSFSKGSSTQTYPSSMMGAVALLRQTYLDADWYVKNKSPREGLNRSLQAFHDQQSLPQIFEATNKWDVLRADRIGDEFGQQYIIRAGGDEYQRMDAIAATRAAFIVPLKFPEAQEVEDPLDARFVSLSDMMHWELAPTNPAAFEKSKIEFALTASGLKDPKDFWPALKKAIRHGLSRQSALDALTSTPARLLKIDDQLGSLQPGKLANFLITSDSLFSENNLIYENWVKGERHPLSQTRQQLAGRYQLTINTKGGAQNYQLEITRQGRARLLEKDTIAAELELEEGMVQLNFTPVKKVSGRANAQYRLSGRLFGRDMQGIGTDSSGRPLNWSAVYRSDAAAAKDSAAANYQPPQAKILYPFSAYGNEQVPRQESILIRNATIWTNESEGVLEGTDILLENGKISRIGKNINAAHVRQIDGTGTFVTPGIIDEHSHIACFSINEGGQSVTSEVRIGDNLNPEDINIYRQLSGGVTSSHILHGSANTIGGQTQLIKLRWGADDQGLKFRGADPFIKFALGENVKRTAQYQGNIRFPDTRMGVQALLADAFQRARDYQQQRKSGDKSLRRDLELDALVEILEQKRFITCHSYVASEILALLHTAETYGFKINTLTHVLEGYKIADRIKKHGANVSTFSDWWAYKLEVQDAIAYNAALMQKTGLNVCINSDDPEMARRLNQEAAKTMKYGGMTEEEAFKMITLNPARALHIEDRVGSLKPGKDADIVIWSANPLTIYAKAIYTIIDGTIYYDRTRDSLMHTQIQRDRNRLIQKMLTAAKKGAPTVKAQPKSATEFHCEDVDHTGTDSNSKADLEFYE